MKRSTGTQSLLRGTGETKNANRRPRGHETRYKTEKKTTTLKLPARILRARDKTPHVWTTMRVRTSSRGAPLRHHGEAQVMSSKSVKQITHISKKKNIQPTTQPGPVRPHEEEGNLEDKAPPKNFFSHRWIDQMWHAVSASGELTRKRAKTCETRW